MRNTRFLLFLFCALFISSCIGDDIVYTATGMTSSKVCESTPTSGPTEIFKVVEDAPAFPGCEDEEDRAEKKKCAEEKMLAFIADNLVYPSVARQLEIEGIVVVSFVVETDGCISGITLVKDIGGGCGLTRT